MMINPLGDSAPTERLNKNPRQAPAHHGFRQPSQPAQASVEHRTSDQSGRGQTDAPSTSQPARTGPSTSGNAKPPTAWASPG